MNNSTGPHSPGHDDEDLKALLRSIDPAASLPDIDPAWTTWKARQTMTTPTTVIATATKAARGRRRLFAGAGLGTAAAGIVAAIAIGTSGAAVTALTVPTAATGGPAAACAPVSADSLSQSDLAFEADVSAINDGTVTLEVTHRYKGDVEDKVSVPQQPTNQLSEFGPGSFTDGASYLITTTSGGVVTACGASGPASAELRSLYQQAFNS